MANYPRVTHPCAAEHTKYCYLVYSARLACLIHAASVRSEPESNSQVDVHLTPSGIPGIKQQFQGAVPAQYTKCFAY